MKIGSRPGRKNICWHLPPLLWFKQLAVIVHQHEGIPIRAEARLHDRTVELFPKVTKLLGARCTFGTVAQVCADRGRPYTPHKLSDRVNSGLHYNEAWVRTANLLPVRNAYLCALGHTAAQKVSLFRGLAA